MPELPEAEAVVRRLRKQARHADIVEAHVERARVVEPQTPSRVEKLARNASIAKVRRRGKQVLIDLSNDLTMKIHLGMTGDLYVIEDSRFRPVSARAWFRFEDGRALVFDDPRALGRLNVFTAEELAHAVRHLGVEPLSPEFGTSILPQLAARSQKPVKLFLMDQTHIAGLGNIYAAESLFHAGIHPLRIAGKLRSARLERLREAIVQVLKDAIQSACTAYMHPGRFREAEAFAPQVYGREGEPCFRCGRKIRRIQQGGRSTYFCPGCQT
jgi:formamidopyrimidine-DNA glycosylase